VKRKAALATVAEAGEAEQVARWPTPAQSGELVAAVQTGVGSRAPFPKKRLLAGSQSLLVELQSFVPRSVEADPRVQPPSRSP
jgi:hypothetical protein